MTIFSFWTIKTGVSSLQNFFLGKGKFWLCVSVPTKNTIISFPCARSFFRFAVEKNPTPKWNKLFNSIISQWNCWMHAESNKLLNKTKTAKHRCEKSKCRVPMCQKKNSWSNSFSSSTKTWNSPFECLSIKICCTHNLFL